jgi:hypothetical protein
LYLPFSKNKKQVAGNWKNKCKATLREMVKKGDLDKVVRSLFFFLFSFRVFFSSSFFPIRLRNFSKKKKLDLPLSITDQGAKVATEWPEGMETDSEAVYGSEEEESSGGATGTEKEHEEEHEEEHGSGELEPASTAETAESPRGSSAEAGPEEAEAEVSEQEQSAELEHEADVSEEAEAEEEEHEAEEGDEEGEPSDEEAMEEEAAAPAAKAAARRQAPAKGRFFFPSLLKFFEAFDESFSHHPLSSPASKSTFRARREESSGEEGPGEAARRGRGREELVLPFFSILFPSFR